MLEKAERFAPGAGKKHRQKMDAEYAQSVTDGNRERDEPSTATSAPLPAAGGGPAADPGSSAP